VNDGEVSLKYRNRNFTHSILVHDGQRSPAFTRTLGN